MDSCAGTFFAGVVIGTVAAVIAFFVLMLLAKRWDGSR